MSIGPTSSRLSLSIVVVVVVVEFLASGPLVFSELCGGGVPTSAGRLRTLGFCRYAVKSLRSIPPCSLRHSPHCYSPQAHPCPYLPPPPVCRTSSSSCCSGTTWCHHLLPGHPPPAGSSVFMHRSNMGRSATHSATVFCRRLI